VVEYYISMENQITSQFRSLINDFLKDLTNTYSDYSYLWLKWLDIELSEDDIQSLFEYCVKVYPERFFDILYQNEDIFKPDSEINVNFLPNVNFRLLYNCEDITESTKKAIWKYLQLVLFSIVGGIKDKTNFGDTMNMFENIDENDLQQKLKETMSGITDFFTNVEKEKDNVDENNEESRTENNSDESTNPKDHFKNIFENLGSGFGGLPNMENIQDHLKTLFDGKIGKLAKELAEEISGEFGDIIGDDMKDAKDTQDVIKKLMKDPKKIMDLMKKVSGKLDSKMKSGDISRDELMKEAGDLVNKMKEMGGKEQFAEMFKKMASSMGSMGKNMKLDTNALDRMTKHSTTREKMLSKLEQRKKLQVDEIEKRNQEFRKRVEEQQKIAADFSVSTKQDNNLVFRLEGEESQEKSMANSFVHPDLLKEMSPEKAPVDKSNKKKKNKKKK